MCGIAGLLTPRGLPAERDALEAMVAAIGHRGPDQTGIIACGSIGMAAARLSIVDPTAAGAQPFADEHAALAFNGEIYNHRELGLRLEAEGVSFRGRSDTEVLFHALHRWGVEETLPRLRGMFAFAYADLARQTVSLVRDRLGIKPLTWCEHAGGLAWASEAKALGAVVPLEPDPVQAMFAVTGSIERSSSLTAFRGIRQLPPGHWLRAGPDSAPKVASWWRLADQVDASLYADLNEASTEELADRLDALLRASVERMAGDGTPMGAFVSGGVDSSLITSIAAEGAAPPELFTADVGGDYSEVPAAQHLAAWLGRPLVVSPFPRRALLTDWARATWHLETPMVTHVNSLPFGRVALTAHDHGLRSALTGEGADELFFGYPESAAARYRAILATPRRVGVWLTERLPHPYGSALAPSGASQADFVAELVGHFRRERIDAAGTEAFDFLAPEAATRHGAVLAWLGEHLLTLLHRNDAMGMAAGVEARFPFLDEDVVRFGVNLPVSAKLAAGRRFGSPKHPFVEDKAIVRRIAARRLPEPIARRPKAGFPAYGHQHVRFGPGFWTNGYVEDLLALEADAVTHLHDEADPYLVAKLASVEVFGRLYAHGHETATVSDHLQRHARVLP